MIPKKIHYCWFGGKPLPNNAKKCIASWKAFFPDYEIIEWNEKNYDVNKIPYISQAYAAGKYAYVSDYARFDILYREGGLYFDTDVEVIRGFEDIVKNGAFFGCEIDGALPPDQDAESLSGKKYGEYRVRVSPGLGMGSLANNPFYKDFLDFYEGYRFYKDDGTQNSMAVVRITTGLLAKKGLLDISGIQVVENITIYPAEYFNPLNSATGIISKTENTRSIHWYSLSWMSTSGRIRVKVLQRVRRLASIFSGRGKVQ